MAGITGQGTTYNLPNYVGELFGITPEDTPFLSAIGGLTGGVESNGNIYHTWSYFDQRTGSSSRQRLEGADAPTAEARVRASANNVLEIHQEAFEVSYTKLAAIGLIDAVSTGNPSGGAFQGANPVTNELDWQVAQGIKSKALDIEETFINGTFVDPSTNGSARATRGLRAAITTNTTDLSDANVTVAGVLKDAVLDQMQEVWENGGIMESETRTLIVNAPLKRQLTAEFISSVGYIESSRNVGGVNLQTFETDFGRCNIMLNRHMPTDEILIVSLEECAPVFLNIPGKGHFFVEPLAKTGAANRVQLYGEIGLKYGNERKHGRIYNAGGYQS